MPFCAHCESRPSRCLRRCERRALGEHLWRVVQDDLARSRGETVVPPHLAWERQSSDVQHALVAGAQAIREMAR